MTEVLTQVESKAAELSSQAFKAFCDDISGMFGVPMQCGPGQITTETVADLEKRFEKLVAVNLVKAQGTLEGTFQIIFGRKGLFILAGLITMPEQMTSLLEKCVVPAQIQQNIKSGTLKEAQAASDSLSEAGNLLVGSWDRVFREQLENHKHFVQSDVFIGEPWDDPEEKLGLARDEEFTLVCVEITVTNYPPFTCGAVFPDAVFGKTKDEEKIKAEAEAKVKAEAEEKAEAQVNAEADAQDQAQAETGQKAKRETEEEAESEGEGEAKAKDEPQAEAKDQSEEKTEGEGEAKAKDEPQTEAKVEDEEKTESEGEAKAKDEPQTEAKDEGEAKAKDEPQAEAKDEDEEETESEGEAKAKDEPQTEAKDEDEEKTESEGEAKAKDEPQAEAKNEDGTEAKAEDEPQVKDQSEEKAEGATEAKAEEESEGEEKAEIETQSQAQAEEKAEAESEEEDSDQNKGKPEQQTGQSSDQADTEAVEDAAKEEAAATDESREPTSGQVSEAIQKMADSVAVLPDQAVSISLATPASNIMKKDVVWSSPDDSVQQALTKMQQQDAGYLMVGTDGVLEGIVSNSNITGAISPYLRPVFTKWRRPLDDASLNIRIKWVMSRPVRVIKPQTPLAAIMENMAQSGSRCLPVADEQNKILGLVTVFDIFELLNRNANVSSAGNVAQAPPLVQN
jgi:CBS domain-containing protein